MNAAERDELLIRVDERLKALKDGDEGAVPEVIERLTRLNGRVAKNSTFRKVGTWVGGILFLVIITLLGNVLMGG